MLKDFETWCKRLSAAVHFTTDLDGAKKLLTQLGSWVRGQEDHGVQDVGDVKTAVDDAAAVAQVLPGVGPLAAEVESVVDLGAATVDKALGA